MDFGYNLLITTTSRYHTCQLTMIITRESSNTERILLQELKVYSSHSHARSCEVGLRNDLEEILKAHIVTSEQEERVRLIISIEIGSPFRRDTDLYANNAVDIIFFGIFIELEPSIEITLIRESERIKSESFRLFYKRQRLIQSL